jgi:hypothetical protein
MSTQTGERESDRRSALAGSCPREQSEEEERDESSARQVGQETSGTAHDSSSLSRTAGHITYAAAREYSVS